MPLETYDIIRYTRVIECGGTMHHYIWRLVARVMAPTRASAERFAVSEYGPDVRIREDEELAA